MKIDKISFLLRCGNLLLWLRQWHYRAASCLALAGSRTAAYRRKAWWGAVGGCCLAWTVQAQPGTAFRCGTPDPTPAELRTLQQYGQALSLARPTTGPMAYVPLRVHIVRRSDGTGGPDEAVLYQSLAETNALYAQASIQLYLCGAPRYIDNTALYDFNQSNETALTAAPNYDDNLLNVYLTHSIQYGTGAVSGYAYINPGNGYRKLIISEITARVFSHELGHTFGLAHTFTNNNSPVVASRELVARTNCTTTGDLLCDTPADPYNLSGATTTGCAYTGTITDAQGQVFAPAMGNGMSYWVCGYAYTAGQYAAMQANRQATQAALACAAAAPPAPTALAVSSTGCLGRILLTWQLPTGGVAAVGYFIERAVGTGDFAAIGAVLPGAVAFQDNTAPANTAVQYRLKPINAVASFGNVVSLNTGRLYCPAPNRAPFCDAQGNSISLGSIAISRAGTPVLNYTSAVCPSSSYTGHYAQPLSLLPGATFTFSVALRQASNGYYPQHLSIWLDLNQNGSFADASELLFRSTQVQTVYNGTFTVPASVANGCGALRIRSQSASDGIVADPCATLTWGETHDYPAVFGALTATAARAGLPSLLAHPNPAHGTATVALPAGLAGQPLRLRDALGREVRRFAAPAPGTTEALLDLRGLSAGLYLLHAGAATGRLVVE